MDLTNTPTMHDVWTLAHNDTTIHAVLKLHQLDQLTEKDTLIVMVIALTEQKKEYFDKIVRLNMNSSTPLRVRD